MANHITLKCPTCKVEFDINPYETVKTNINESTVNPIKEPRERLVTIYEECPNGDYHKYSILKSY